MTHPRGTFGYAWLIRTSAFVFDTPRFGWSGGLNLLLGWASSFLHRMRGALWFRRCVCIKICLDFLALRGFSARDVFFNGLSLPFIPLWVILYPLQFLWAVTIVFCLQGLGARAIIKWSWRSVAGKFKLICKYLLCFGFALSNQISDICKINLFRNGLILIIAIQSFGHWFIMHL